MDQNVKPNSALGITGFVLGIIALVSSWVPIVNNFSAFLAVLGLIFAIIGAVQTTKGTRSGKGLAIAGLIICIISFVVVVFTQYVYSTAWNQAVEENFGTTAPSTTQSQTGSTSTAEANSTPRYVVSIDSCVLTTDSQGNQAVVVTYTWTNNDDSNQMFSVAIGHKAFQNGVQLDGDYFMSDASSYDLSSTTNEIQPGATQTVQCAYKLNDQSDITLECTQNFSLSDEVLAQKTFQVA